MFLSSKYYSEMDAILKEFEVGLRSYVANQVITYYPKFENFKEIIDQLKTNFEASAFGVTPLLFQKYLSKLKAWEKDGKLSELYRSIEFTNECYLKKEHYEDSEVPYLSGVLDLLVLFNNPLFTDFTKKFGSEFNDFLNLYLKTRNSSSHPGSTRVSVDDSRQLIQFLIVSVSNILEKYFWYVGTEEIKKKISIFINKLNDKPIIRHNLSQITQQHEQLLLRETELGTLNNILLNIRRRASSVVLHGYGGVGKTALALEFCYQLLEDVINGEENYDFICWASSKTDELIFERSGFIKVRDIQPQYQTFQELITLISNVIGHQCSEVNELMDQLNTFNQGIIIIDNYENINDKDREKLDAFINDCPHNIQFLITSRQVEEIADKRIEIKGFKEISTGTEFIQNYRLLNNYKSEFSQSEIQEFIELSCGNTLVMTLMLDRIFEGIMDIKTSLETLKPLQSRDVNEIAEFMYRNMFDRLILENEKKFPEIKKVLNLILLYNEPIDFYSLNELTNVEWKKLEEMLSLLTQKYIINRIKGLYELNEMAVKFISLKLMPDKQGIKTLTDAIYIHKDILNQALKKLEEDVSKNNKLESIISDWQPNFSSETVAIARAYQLYDDYKIQSFKFNENRTIDTMSNVEVEFSKLMRRSRNPYISFQKARILKLFLYKVKNQELRKKLLDEIGSAYDTAYFDIYTGGYSHIINTVSYPALLLFIGVFHYLDNKNPAEGIKFLEMSSDIYSSRNDISENNANVNYYLAQACCELYIDTREEPYLNKTSKYINLSVMNYNKIHNDKSSERKEELVLIHTFVQYMQKNIKKNSVANVIKNYDKVKPRMAKVLRTLKEEINA